MAIQQYVLDAAAMDWQDHKDGVRKMLGVGPAGGPFAGITKPPEGQQPPAHFHDIAQFQVSLEGLITFPGHPLEPIGVYYSDPYVAYGPFVVGPNHLRGLFRPEASGHSVKGGIVWMSDREGRKSRNPQGREFFGQSQEVQWEELQGELAGHRRKDLFGNAGQEGPKAEVWECPPNASLPREATQFGEFLVLFNGSARFEGREVKPQFIRYVVGDEAPGPIASGPEGATWLILTFDQAAEQRSPEGTLVQAA